MEARWRRLQQAKKDPHSRLTRHAHLCRAEHSLALLHMRLACSIHLHSDVSFLLSVHAAWNRVLCHSAS